MSENESNEQESSSVFIDFEQIEQVSLAFAAESQEILRDLDDLILKLESHPEDVSHINALFRKVHTLKGSVGAVPGGQLLGSLAHEFEALLGRIKKENRTVTRECVDLFLHSSRLFKVMAEALRDKRELFPEELSESIEIISRYGSFQFLDGRVPLKKPASPIYSEDVEEGVWLSRQQFNEMLRLSGELLVLKNFFQMMNQTVQFRLEPDLFERRQGDFSHSLTKICEQFQGHMQAIRKEKIGDSFQGLTVLVRQSSTELNKSVQLNQTGMDHWIDKTMGKDIYEALVHLVRNSIDHGIEDQFERTVLGKPSIGQLSLDVAEKNGVIHLAFSDDGNGLDRERILARAVKMGLLSEAEAPHLRDEEIYKFIFQAGFSTRDKVTTISGRGVGMDVVQNIVDKYEGQIQIESQAGHGTTFRLSFPIPQNVMVENALLCRWAQFQLAVPLTSVAHISSCSELKVNTVDHLRYCQYNGLTVPLLNYREILNFSMDDVNFEVQRHSAVFIKTKMGTLALMVDHISAQTDLVIKPFGGIIKSMKGFKGVSILADEKVTYVVDPDSLLQLVIRTSLQEVA